MDEDTLLWEKIIVDKWMWAWSRGAESRTQMIYLLTQDQLMLMVPCEGFNTAAGPSPRVPGWIPATVTSEASTAPKQGSFGTPTTIRCPVALECRDASIPTGKCMYGSSQHAPWLTWLPEMGRSLCFSLQGPSSSLLSMSHQGMHIRCSFSPRRAFPLTLRPWLPSAPGEQHVKPSSVSPPCPQKGGDEGDAGAEWLELGGRHGPELPAPH